ncbi:uncharacterized protein C1orf112 homolog [Lingula anatina]|uniref:Uncharacterized protein C1orf112 homolog n=1 Tax=Lingula anatina TaxID=7574 RepID=A0A1S3IBJ9_LINAN|nr:uncharacterized protein C1orf112 homolog [Lingula anatina]|eukprot:XP_013395632.1 uncharacterized protein C1orf112 homolog [Lingula anatina]
MSQSSMLDEVGTWRETECQARWQEVLPELLNSFSAVEDGLKEIGLLKLLCQSLVPHIPSTDLEKQVEESFHRLLGNVVSLVKNNSRDILEEIAQQLEMASTLIDSIEQCVKCVCGDSEVEISSFLSLSKVVLSILKESYQHCKTSSSVYGDLLGMLSEGLSAIFKKTHSLQMSFISLLDKVVLGSTSSDEDIEHFCAGKTSSSVYGDLLGMLSEGLSAIFKKTHSLQMSFISLLDKVVLGSTSSDEDIEHFCAALLNLHELCAIVNTLDVKITITTWKAVSKLACQHKDSLRNRLDVSVLVTSLCLEVLTLFRHLFQLAPQTDKEGNKISCGDPKAFSKSVKVAGFQMKVLVTLVKEFEGYLGNCVRELYQLLQELHRHMPPSLSAPSIPKQYTEDIERQVTIATEPMLTHLLGNREFIECLMDTEGFDKEMCLSKCLLQMV